MNNKSQIWGFDLMIAITLFLIGIVSIYIYAINFTSESEDILNSFFYQGNLASSLILSQGTPENWNLTNVEVPGILSENKVNKTKLNLFYNLTNSSYKSMQEMLGLSYDFYFNFTEMKVYNEEKGIGKKPENQENLIKIERLTIYNKKPVKFILIVWN